MKPQCGRLVAFNAGEYHGVKAVTSGRRCAIAVWFTLDRHKAEKSRQAAYEWVEKAKRENLEKQKTSENDSKDYKDEL